MKRINGMRRLVRTHFESREAEQTHPTHTAGHPTGPVSFSELVLGPFHEVRWVLHWPTGIPTKVLYVTQKLEVNSNSWKDVNY